MGVIDILFIGIGLSMDAFAVSICKGLKMKVVDLKQCLMIAWFWNISGYYAHHWLCVKFKVC